MEKTREQHVIRVLLVDDHHMIRQGLKALLEHDGIIVVGEASDGRRALEMALELKPDVIIMDLNMPNLNGIDATARVCAELPRTRVVALSAHNDRQRILATLRAGASAYVLKDSAYEELVTAARKVASGETYFGAGVSNVIAEYFHDASGAENGARLTVREREVLQLFAEGKSTKEAAAALKLSVKTVETHRRAIMEKLNLYSVAELTKHAIREGLTSLER